MQAVLDEVIEKVAQFSDEDRDKLIQVLQEQKNKYVIVRIEHAHYFAKAVTFSNNQEFPKGEIVTTSGIKSSLFRFRTRPLPIKCFFHTCLKTW